MNARRLVFVLVAAAAALLGVMTWSQDRVRDGLVAESAPDAQEALVAQKAAKSQRLKSFLKSPLASLTKLNWLVIILNLSENLL